MLKSRFMYAMMAAVMAFSFSACSDDDDNGGEDVGPKVLDGLYVKGAGTALSELKTAGRLSVAKNEVLQEDRASLYEVYVAVKKGSEGFNLVNVAGSEIVTLGPGSDFAAVTEEDLHVDEPKDGLLQKGGVVESETPFTVQEDGLYHVVYDSELKKGAISKVTWGVIGAATPGGWGTSTVLAMKAFDLNKIEFEATGIALVKGDYKYRYSNGWKIFLDDELDLGEGKKGVTVNTNLGGALNALVPGGDNIVFDGRGLYTLSFVWELAKAPVASLTKTGDLDVTDYSTYEMGIIGNVYSDGAAQATWNVNYPGKTLAPEKDGNVYTWTYSDLALTEGVPAEGEEWVGEFKFRQGEGWDGKSIGFNDVELSGNAAENIVNNGGNFAFKSAYAGTYDIVLTIDAATEIYSVTINKK